MKQVKIWMTAIVLMMGLSFTGCLSNNDDGERPVEGVVTVNQGIYGTGHFSVNKGAIKYYPSSASMLAVETEYGFRMSNSKVAYIQFTYNEFAEENQKENEFHGVLHFATSIDATIHESTKGSENDPEANAPFYTLSNPNFSGYYPWIHEDQYLVFSSFYLTNNNEKEAPNHNIYLVCYPEEITAESTGVTFYLRHVVSETDYKANAYYEYLRAYDIKKVLDTFQRETGKATCRVKVETMVSESSNELDKATAKEFYVDYKYPTAE